MQLSLQTVFIRQRLSAKILVMDIIFKLLIKHQNNVNQFQYLIMILHAAFSRQRGSNQKTLILASSSMILVDNLNKTSFKCRNHFKALTRTK